MDSYTAYWLRNGYQADADRFNQDFRRPQTSDGAALSVPLGDFCSVKITGTSPASGVGGPPTTYSYTIIDLNGIYGTFVATVNPQLRNPSKRYAPFIIGSTVIWNVITGYIETPELDASATKFAVVLAKVGGSAGSNSAYCTFTYQVSDYWGNPIGGSNVTAIQPDFSPARMVMCPCNAATLGDGWYDATNGFHFVAYETQQQCAGSCS